MQVKVMSEEEEFVPGQDPVDPFSTIESGNLPLTSTSHPETNTSADCLVCGSTTSCTVIRSTESRRRWAFIFHEFYKIENQNETDDERQAKNDIFDTIQSSFYCLSCLEEINSMERIYREIKKLQHQLRLLKLSYENKFKSSLNKQITVENNAVPLTKRKQLVYYYMQKNVDSRALKTEQDASISFQVSKDVETSDYFDGRGGVIMELVPELDAFPLYRTNQEPTCPSNSNSSSETRIPINHQIQNSFDSQEAALNIGRKRKRIAKLTFPEADIRVQAKKGRKSNKSSETRTAPASTTHSRASQSLKRARQTKAKSDKAKAIKEKSKSGSVTRDLNPHLLFVCPYNDCTRKRKKYLTEFLRDVHVRKYHQGMKKKPYACLLCGYTCQNKNLLTQHQNFHTGATPFQCTHSDDTTGAPCAAQFETYQRLVDHKRKKHTPQSFVCNQCGKSLTSRLGYKLHLQTHSALPRPKLQCELCGKTFAQQNSLNHHRRTNHELTPAQIESESKDYKCAFCDKIFVGKTRLKFHERIHTTQYRCEICNYGAAGRNALNDHINTVHSNARPFSCQLCGHTFKVKRDLNRHQKTVHPATKDFMCSDCGKCFSNKRYLQDHEEIHKDVKSYLCVLCGKYFAQRTSLKVHVKSMHKEVGSEGEGHEEEPLGENPALDHFKPILHGEFPQNETSPFL